MIYMNEVSEIEEECSSYYKSHEWELACINSGIFNIHRHAMMYKKP